ncbi:MAG TPA: hypothetical protein VFE49_11970 [Jiangellaceae bacterium]|nr:hypothetical protein [Jiangellaceae bacterium]
MPGAGVDGATRPSRRGVLLGTAAISLAACTGAPSPPTDQVPPPPEPDALLRGRVAAAERTMLALYAATSAQHPTLADRLLPFAVHHGRHLAVVESSGPVTTATPSTPAGTASPGRDGESPTPEAVPRPHVPADLAAAVVALRAAERAAADARIADCLRSEDRPLAEVLAAVAACEAAHDVLLGQEP